MNERKNLGAKVATINGFRMTVFAVLAKLVNGRESFRTGGARQSRCFTRVLGPVQHQEQIQPERHRAEVALQTAHWTRLAVTCFRLTQPTFHYDSIATSF